MMSIGIDIQNISDFKKALKNGGESFLRNHYYLSELGNRSADHLCGIFAAKEAIFKTGFLSNMDFLKVMILPDKSGRPWIYNQNGKLVKKLSLSISHTKDVVVAVVVYDDK